MKPIRYNRHRNRLHVDMDWQRIGVDHWIIVEAFEIVDPAVYPDVWKDWWLQKYGKQLVKRQWGENMSKFGQVQLLDGVEMTGQQKYEEAVQEIEKLEQEMILNYSLPVGDLIG